MKSPLFTVLLPTHNRADVISYAIQSALSQTCSDFELLVAGDGCTDETASIVQEFVRKDKRVQWFSFPKSAGFGYANRNTVLQKAQGKFVAYLGHDDLWLPHHLEVMAEFFGSHPNHLIAYTQPLWMTDQGTILPSYFDTDAPRIREVFWHEHNEIPAICMVVKRMALEQAGSWIPGTKNAGDWDLWRRILSLDPQKKLGFVRQPTTINFKSNWRSDAEFLNPQLQIQQRLFLLSPELLKPFTVKRAARHATWEQAVWEQLQVSGWREQLVTALPLLEDELLYRAVQEIENLTAEGGLIAFVRRLKQLPIHEKYLSFRRRWLTRYQ